MRGLLTLLVGEPALPQRVLGKTPTDDQVDVETFFSVAGETREAKVHAAQMMFSKDALGEDIPTVFSSWFEKRDLLQTPISLYFGTLYNARGLIEFQFLALIQALESLHRRLHGGKYLPDEEYAAVEDAVVSALPPGIPSDLRRALESRIKYGNEFAQRRRFKELLASTEEAGRALVDPSGDFVARVVAQRNYLTHLTEDNDYPPMELHTLYEYALRLRALATLLLLIQIGIDSSRGVEAIRKTRWFRGFVG